MKKVNGIRWKFTKGETRRSNAEQKNGAVE
jgi:hypothetical protein